MHNKIPAAMFWSGGKDSSLALYRIKQAGKYDVKWLITTVSEEFQRISMHGVRLELLEEQCRQIGLPLRVMETPQAPDNTAYEQAMGKVFSFLKQEGIAHVIYGDIFLEDLREYRDKHLKAAGLTGVYPLWKENTTKLYEEFILLGFKAITVAVNKPTPGEKFAGRILDRSFQQELPENVDPCGENGEFHTFVFDGPIFSNPVAYGKGKTEIHGYKGTFDYQLYFTDLKLKPHV